MSTARKVLMIIAFVLSILAVIGFAICAVAFFVAMGNDELLRKTLDGMNRQTMTLEEGKTLFMVFGVIFAILVVFELINGLLAIKGVKHNRAGLMVLNIVFGILAGIYVNSLGGIFGLVDSKKEQ